MSKTLFELKQNLATVGQQLQKVEGELASAAIDTTKSTEDIKNLQKSRDDLKMRFDIIQEQHDDMEVEIKNKFKAVEVGVEGLPADQQMVKAKAEFIRAAIQDRPVAEDIKQLIAIPKGNPTGGDNFLPTNMQNELVHEPFSRNQLREVAQISSIKGLELPRISFTLDDDDFITDEQTAKEMKLKGDTVSFGRNKFKVKAKISDTVIHGSDVELVNYVDNALRSGLAAKERRDALDKDPKTGLEHMSFYNGTEIKRVNGTDLYKAIKAAIADLHEDYRDNAEIVMRYADYMDIIEVLANGNATLYNAQPEQVLGKPVTFADGAVNPIVGDFSYFRINYDGMTYDTDKDVDSGNYLFVLTAWYDQQRSLDSAFRIAEVTPNAPSNPEPPTGLKADEVTDSSAKISWDAVGYAGGIKEYEIYRDGSLIDTRVGTTFSDSGLTPETTYEYQVKAIGNNDLESELSEVLSITTEEEIPEV